MLKQLGAALGPAEFARMRELDAAMGEAVAAEDFDRFFDLNTAFHEIYLGRSDNKRLLAQVRLLKQRLTDWPRRKPLLDSWEESCLGEHDHFIQLLEQGRVHEAAALTQDVHWSFTGPGEIHPPVLLRQPKPENSHAKRAGLQRPALLPPGWSGRENHRVHEGVPASCAGATTPRASRR